MADQPISLAFPMHGIDRIDSESRRALLELLKRQGATTLKEAMEETDLARTTLREHLAQLERDGLVSSSRRREGRGRPELQFELTPSGQSLFPNQSAQMLGRLIGFLQEAGEQDLLEAFFRTYWENRLEEARGRLSEQRSGTDDQVGELIKLLEEEGFMPEIRQDGPEDELVVRACNCPFPEAVRRTRLPCQLEVRFYEELFDQEVERTGYIPDGDLACTYRIGSD